MWGVSKVGKWSALSFLLSFLFQVINFLYLSWSVSSVPPVSKAGKVKGCVFVNGGDHLYQFCGRICSFSIMH